MRTDPRGWRDHPNGWLAPLLVLAVGALYLGLLFVTHLEACGILGCSNPSKAVFSPAAAQVWLLVCGLTLASLTPLLAHGRAWRTHLVVVVMAIVLGTTLAMVVLRLGVDGCPWALDRTTRTLVIREGALPAGTSVPSCGSSGGR